MVCMCTDPCTTTNHRGWLSDSVRVDDDGQGVVVRTIRLKRLPSTHSGLCSDVLCSCICEGRQYAKRLTTKQQGQSLKKRSSAGITVVVSTELCVGVDLEMEGKGVKKGVGEGSAADGRSISADLMDNAGAVPRGVDQTIKTSLCALCTGAGCLCCSETRFTQRNKPTLGTDQLQAATAGVSSLYAQTDRDKGWEWERANSGPDRLTEQVLRTQPISISVAR
jgi:hypothetical protein